MGSSNLVSLVQNPYSPSCIGDLQKGSTHLLSPCFLHPIKNIIGPFVFFFSWEDKLLKTLVSYLKKPMELPNCICCTLEPLFTCFSWRLSGSKSLNIIFSNNCLRCVNQVLVHKRIKKKAYQNLNKAISKNSIGVVSTS